MANTISLVWTAQPARHTLAPQRIAFDAGDAVTLAFSNTESGATQVGRLLALYVFSSLDPDGALVAITNASFTGRTADAFSVKLTASLTSGLAAGDDYTWEVWDVNSGAEQLLSFGVASVSEGGPNLVGTPVSGVTTLGAGGTGSNLGATGPGVVQQATTGANLSVLAYSAAPTYFLSRDGTWRVPAGGGSGDMTKSVYDQDDDGIVDIATTAANAVALGGSVASAYAKLASPIFTGTPRAPTQTAGNNTTFLATTQFVQNAVAGAVTGLLDFKGSTDASSNPNYPAASAGDAYVVSVAGKVGGASGVSVDVGDVYVASADNAGGTQASVGTSWFVLEHNLAGTLLAANNLSDLTSLSAARTNLGLPANKAFTAVADAATITFDLSGRKKFKTTLGGNRTLALANDEDGDAFAILLTQDGTGSRTVTWWAGIRWAGGTAPTLTTTAGKADLVSFIRVGSEYLGMAARDF